MLSPDKAGASLSLIDDSESFSEVLHSLEGNVSLSGHDCSGKDVSGSNSTFGSALCFKVGDSDVLVERQSVQPRGNPNINSIPAADK